MFGPYVIVTSVIKQTNYYGLTCTGSSGESGRPIRNKTATDTCMTPPFFFITSMNLFALQTAGKICLLWPGTAGPWQNPCGYSYQVVQDPHDPDTCNSPALAEEAPDRK